MARLAIRMNLNGGLYPRRFKLGQISQLRELLLHAVARLLGLRLLH